MRERLHDDRKEAAVSGDVVGSGVDVAVGHEDGPGAEHVAEGRLDLGLVVEVAGGGVAGLVLVRVRDDRLQRERGTDRENGTRLRKCSETKQIGSH